MNKTVGYLRLINGPQQGGVFVLKALSVFEIGRGEACQIRLDDPSVCVNHARIYRKGELWTFFDLNSEGGCSINDIRVEKRGLEGGEIIRLGVFELQFTFEVPTSGEAAEQDDDGEVGELEARSVHKTPFVPAADDDAPTEPPEPEQSVAEPVASDDPDPPRLITPYDQANAGRAQVENPPGAEDVCLKIIDGDSRDIGKTLLLDPTRDYILGRSENCNMVLNDGKVSRLHCRIECSGGHFQITDLNSANGTILNGERVLDASLRLGDYVRLGFTVITYMKVTVEV